MLGEFVFRSVETSVKTIDYIFFIPYSYKK
jgi:hypothetical protein